MKNANSRFILTIWVCLLLAWVTSGDQFLNLMFAMPDLGPIDESALEGVIRADDMKQALGLTDWFGALRAMIHRTTGLG